MKKIKLPCVLFLLAIQIPLPARASEAAKGKGGGAIVDRVGDTAFIQLKAESFKTLTPREKELAYWLVQAAIAVDPIIYDQRSRWGLRQKRLLEEIVAHPDGIDPHVFKKIAAFAKLFWANRGNHNETTSQKFVPDFTPNELKGAALQALGHGAFKTPSGDVPAVASEADLSRELDELHDSLFNPDFEPMITAKSPQGGKDILQASANNLYSDVSLADIKNFKERNPLNSRLSKKGEGIFVEEVYRAGTPDGSVAPGLYASYLGKANEYLEKAAAVADPGQAEAIRDLVRYYQTGEYDDWVKHGIAWVQSNPRVDFSNGFVEVYLDPRGAKAAMQGFVTITDEKLNKLMLKLADNAQYFEDRAPWDSQYRKQGVKPPLAKAVETLAETADFAVTVIGDNLPNENEIHEKYGSKSFLFTESSRELDHARGHAVLEEFAASPEEVKLDKKYGDEAGSLMTAMHEIIGHGSGKVNVPGNPATYLKEYYSTLEEGRADLMALWNVWDPKLKELGLVSDQENVAKTMYYSAARAPLVQLYRIAKGDTVEEDHMRDRQLIARYIMDKTGAIEFVKRGSKTYAVVKDFQKMREGVGMLLKELMRIKAEGDYAAIKGLVDQYGTHFDPALRDEVLARYKKLNIPTYWAGINPRLDAKLGTGGRVLGVTLSYPRDPVRQYIAYGSMYDPGLGKP